ALAATARSEQARETPGAKMMREAVKRFNLGKPLPPDLRHVLDHNIHADLRDQLWQQNRDRKLTGAATTAPWGKIRSPEAPAPRPHRRNACQGTIICSIILRTGTQRRQRASSITITAMTRADNQPIGNRRQVIAPMCHNASLSVNKTDAAGPDR